MRVLHSPRKAKRTIRTTKARGSHPIRRRRVMERRATNQRRISLPTRLAICVAKQATALRSVQREAPKMMKIHLSKVAAQKEAPKRVLLNSRRK